MALSFARLFGPPPSFVSFSLITSEYCGWSRVTILLEILIEHQVSHSIAKSFHKGAFNVPLLIQRKPKFRLSAFQCEPLADLFSSRPVCILKLQLEFYLDPGCWRWMESAARTSDIVLVGVIQFLYSSVTKSQLPHPVHSSSHTCWQTKVRTTCSCMEAISCKTVGTATPKIH